MESSNRLRQVTKNDILFVTRETAKFLPETSTIYGFFTFGFRYKSVDENRTKIYIPETADSPFFIAVIGGSGSLLCTTLTVYWKIGTIPNATIADYLSSIPTVTWKKAVYFSSCCSDILDELEQIVLDERLCSHTNKRWQLNIASLLLKKDKSTLDGIKLPNGFVLRNLKLSDAKKVVDNLGYVSETVEDVASMIKLLPSAGIYYKPNESAAEELVSWALTKHSGEIGMTMTLQNFRGQNLAAIVTNDILREHERIGHTAYATVLYDNNAALNMHKKVGFTACGSVGYDIYQNPQNDIKEQEYFRNFN